MELIWCQQLPQRIESRFLHVGQCRTPILRILSASHLQNSWLSPHPGSFADKSAINVDCQLKFNGTIETSGQCGVETNQDTFQSVWINHKKIDTSFLHGYVLQVGTTHIRLQSIKNQSYLLQIDNIGSHLL